ncbi:hypothetical protein BJP41_10820 (plasmid) [Candidatus Williamhamiltonella defendens]|uniref:Uncharacterized protein n=1 Tax=Candidatus Williamhamiltonella defendens TaxID=138072 RepID=A0A2D3T4P7_9ENTR|nr:hypothetical protein [Candidatus Hamiltonella defensa]ASV34528.1 hypothetical protein CJJ18_11030 [Candidatus Hamiltonella defensa]ATW30792.1 hypothetical protein BJP41_09930 [Candidatus Hamiltonella defensa]ATW30948.1 hypothetical protein BJP41_10820 [Candidatus Hamiltonella defensa]ATW32781.1 hypothetical protein BJP42_10280 [Candidatus Hamiltonella defensa]ATW32840.1 hypothetical protein BJP42_10630 [Candidatus Hamiltonella defensa]
MATIQLRFKLTDIDWIITRNSNTPSSTVLLTLNERSPFYLMFKEDSLLWAGRRPIMEGVL